MIPRLAVEIAKKFEGCAREVRLSDGVGYVPYRCPASYWTIGWGHLCQPDQPPITQAQADAWLEQDLQAAASAAIRVSPILQDAGEQRLSAIVDFIFNLGAGRYQTSTLRRRVNEGNWAEAAREIRKWVFGGGRKLPGLVARREVEALLLQPQ
ncbi:MAG: lysozyme [Usitatibacter sp.]